MLDFSEGNIFSAEMSWNITQMDDEWTRQMSDITENSEDYWELDDKVKKMEKIKKKLRRSRRRLPGSWWRRRMKREVGDEDEVIEEVEEENEN